MSKRRNPHAPTGVGQHRPFASRRACLLLLAIALALGACEKKSSARSGGRATSGGGHADAAEILFGEVSSLTGPEATFGQSQSRGIALAVREINEAGGVLGRPIRVITYDNQGKPTESAAAANRLIVRDKVHVLLGEVASSRSLAMAPIAEEHRVPMISPASTNPRVTEGKHWVFRVCFIDPFQGLVMAKFAREELGVSRVAVLRDVRNDYSVGLASFFIRAFEDLGGTVLIDQSYSAGDIDFRSQLTEIRAKQPEAIYVPGYYTDVGLIARQARELGLAVPLLGGDGWDSSKLFEIGGEAMEGSFFSNHYSFENPDPVVQTFIQKYREAYGEVPDALAALGYDAARLAADAIERVGTLERSAIRYALATTRNFRGVTGTITIDEDHNSVKPAVVLKIRGGKATFATSIEP
ncbi:MAG TPA: ABC transporter substrate-binding protein [Fredinandcohnia sp.]|nr:ABC transporter substrate-binding protein [Fredinandcohnia sp.]